MTEPPSPHRGEIFAFPSEAPDDPTVDVSGVVYADDQDPSMLAEAGLVSLFHSRLVERAFVGEAMARDAWATRRHLTAQEGADDRGTREAHAAHRGSADLLAMLAPAMAVPFRGVSRLERIATRLLLGRARARLARRPDDREARAIAVNALRALGRRPT